MLKQVKKIVHRSLAAAGYRLIWDPPPPDIYDEEGLRAAGKNLSFLSVPRFAAAYDLGYDGSRVQHLRWRVAITCWAATHGAKLAGDFVECGVSRGLHSLAICSYLDFNKLNKSFWLFDTYRGIPEEQALSSETQARIAREINLYPDCYEEAKRRFAPFPRVHLVQGKVPDTLASVEIDKVAYLSIDMNIAYPERRAIEYFWPKMSPGALVVLDDYAWRGHEAQKTSLDEFALSVGVEILTLPTGQGLMVKI
jgi:hypothetical protein